MFEDEYLLVVDKPAGLVTHPAAGLREPTLVHGLLARGLAGGVDPERPGVVHRLDRDTTGLLVLARDADVHATLVEHAPRAKHRARVRDAGARPAAARAAERSMRRSAVILGPPAAWRSTVARRGTR